MNIDRIKLAFSLTKLIEEFDADGVVITFTKGDKNVTFTSGDIMNRCEEHKDWPEHLDNQKSKKDNA